MFDFDKVRTIVKRELHEKLLSKTFIIMTLLIPGIILISIGIQASFMSYEDEAKKEVIIVSENPAIINELKKRAETEKYETDKKIFIRFEIKTENEFKNELKKIRPLLIDETINGIVFIPKDALRKGKIIFYEKNTDKSLISFIRDEIKNVFVSIYFMDKGINSEDIAFLKKPVRLELLKVTENEIKQKSMGPEILSFIFVILLYMSLLTSGQLILRSVIEEKQNRIVEMVLSSINANELIAGKIIGSSITALVQMIIWISPVIVAISTSWVTLPPELTVDIPFWNWLYFFINFILGLVIFLGLYAAIGSLFDNEQDAGNAAWPLVVLIMIPFFIAISVMKNPTNPLAKITSMLPFTSLFVMPERITFTDVPIYEFIISFVVNLLTLILIIPISGKIYRTAILMTGKKPSFKEIINLIKS